MKVSPLLTRIVLVVLALLVLAYVVASLVNWNDRLPSAAALRLDKVVLDRPAVPDAENAYVYELGYNGPDNAAPADVGARRRTRLVSFQESTDPKSDPLQDAVDFKPDGSIVARLSAACGDDPDRRGCAAEFEKLARDWQPSELDELALRRYETLLQLLASREVVPLDLGAPIPAYGHALNAQRLYLIRLGHLAGQ